MDLHSKSRNECDEKMKATRPLRLFKIEEHHEAFLVWHLAIAAGLLPQKDNILLHVDEHSDADVPRFRSSIKNLNGDLNVVSEFTYNELTISNFIFPALYKGVFKKLYNLHRPHNPDRKKKAKRKLLYVRSMNQSGFILLAGKKERELDQVKDEDRREVVVHSKTIEDSRKEREELVLDIDLDYFSCNESPEQFSPKKIAVTRKEFESIRQNRYHHLRISPNCGSRMKTVEEDGGYYVVFGDYPYLLESKLKVGEEEIGKRIEEFGRFLRKWNVRPRLIDICRSRLSGYTPADQWEFIEGRLLETLASIYPLEVHYIADVLREKHLE